jgi:hypothetical protein
MEGNEVNQVYPIKDIYAEFLHGQAQLDLG